MNRAAFVELSKDKIIADGKITMHERVVETEKLAFAAKVAQLHERVIGGASYEDHEVRIKEAARRIFELAQHSSNAEFGQGEGRDYVNFWLYLPGNDEQFPRQVRLSALATTPRVTVNTPYSLEAELCGGDFDPDYELTVQARTVVSGIGYSPENAFNDSYLKRMQDLITVEDRIALAEEFYNVQSGQELAASISE
jgi:hypothetical protein